MGLPAIIEYLFSLNRPTGGRLCHPNRLQFHIPFLPPLVQFGYSLAPPSGAYAAIKYQMTYGGEMIPGNIYVEATQGGDQYVVGFISSDWINIVNDYFVLFTTAQPIYTKTINYSTLAQVFWGTQWNLLIPSEQDYDGIIAHLAEYGTEETNNLLRQMMEKRPGGRL